jgi:hypothetical protein
MLANVKQGFGLVGRFPWKDGDLGGMWQVWEKKGNCIEKFVGKM